MIVFAGRGHKQTTRTNTPARTLASSTHFILSLALFSLIRLICGMYRDIYKILYNTDLDELFNTHKEIRSPSARHACLVTQYPLLASTITRMCLHQASPRYGNGSILPYILSI